MGIEGETVEEKAKNFVARAKEDPQWAAATIWSYLQRQKERAERGEISYSTLPNYWKPLKLLCEMNDVAINWKRITRGLPRGRKYGLDRAPTKDEIRQLLNYPDRRIKPIVLIMASSGIRVGAWDYLRWGDIQPIERDGKIVAAKLTVYRGEPEQYVTFITPEAYQAVKEWMDFRAQHGEKITSNSWVMRNLWDTSEENGAALPKKLKSTGVKRLIERALWAQGLRKQLEGGKRRHDFAADQGFRKFFKSQCEKSMKSIHVEMLMGHSLGLGDSYYRPTEEELLESYLKAVPDLTIIEQVEKQPIEDINELKRRVAELERWKELEVDKRLKEVWEWSLKLVKTLQTILPNYIKALDKLDEETKRKVIEAWKPLMELNPLAEKSLEDAKQKPIEEHLK